MRLLTNLVMMLVVAATVVGSFSFYNLMVKGANMDSVDPMLVQDINELRVNGGLDSLLVDEGLTQIALIRAKEAADKWSHERPNGHMGYEMVPGNIWKGENLAYVEISGMTAEQAEDKLFKDLCLSSSHLANMMFEYYKRMGVASYRTDDGRVVAAFIFAS